MEVLMIVTATKIELNGIIGFFRFAIVTAGPNPQIIAAEKAQYPTIQFPYFFSFYLSLEFNIAIQANISILKSLIASFIVQWLNVFMIFLPNSRP